MPAPVKKTAVKQPQDHKPKASAAKGEATEQSIKVEYQGNTYEIDRANANNLELLELTEDEKYISAIKGYLGAAQWAKWKDSVRDEKGRVPADGFEDFLNAVMVAIGGSRDDHPNS